MLNTETEIPNSMGKVVTQQRVMLVQMPIARQGYSGPAPVLSISIQHKLIHDKSTLNSI